jgi:hypothetical protein
MENINLKKWYIDTYPTDEMAKDINPEIGFEDVFNTINSYKDIYNLIGVCDSIIRERIFEKLAAITGHTYNQIYNKSLYKLNIFLF